MSSNVKMPEPVAYLVDWPNEIELGFYFSEEKNDSARSRPLITTEQAEAYAQARVNEVLDMMADKASQKYLIPEFATAIRALKEQT